MEHPVMVRLDSNHPLEIEETPEDIQWPPIDLYSDEPPLESDFHRDQINLLIRSLKYWWQDRPDFYISGNLTVYYDKQQLTKRDFRGPDIFVVLGVEKKDRRSWAVWQEGGKYPNVVIELLSSSTATVDRGAKKDLYQDVWRVPNYFWFHPQTMEFAGFHIVDGRYEALVPTENGWLWSDQLQLFLGIYEQQLRYFCAEGQLIPLPEEAEKQAKEQAQQRAAQAQQTAEQAQQRAERLEARLRSQGIDPDTIE